MPYTVSIGWTERQANKDPSLDSDNPIGYTVGSQTLKGSEKMASNSKLTKVQKADRKEMLAALPYGSSMAITSTGITILVVPFGAVDRVYTSVASPDEVKIRRKVGEYHALWRWAQGQDGFAVPAGQFATDQFVDMLES